MSRRLKIIPRFQYTPSSSTPFKGYDEESGLCYTEFTCSGGPMTAEWAWKTTGSSKEYEEYRSPGLGCSSLKDMVVRVVLVNALSITPEVLAEIPYQVAKQLWKRMVASKLDSLHTWKVFASVYPRELTLKTREQLILNPRMNLAHYVTHLTSQSFHWITFLSLEGITCSRSELVQLSKLKNLGALTIGAGLNADCVTFDDSVIRAWMRANNESDAFSMLRVLNFSSQKQITGVSFGYLTHFPHLSMINFENCGIGLKHRSEALRWGWKCKTGEEFHKFPLSAGITRLGWNSIADTCFRRSGAFSIPSLKAKGVEAIDSLPVLHFSLGDSTQHNTCTAQRRHGIKSFQRLTPCSTALEAANGLKRPITDAPKSSGPVCKKPTIRASKQQDLGNLLTGFGS